MDSNELKNNQQILNDVEMYESQKGFGHVIYVKPIAASRPQSKDNKVWYSKSYSDFKASISAVLESQIGKATLDEERLILSDYNAFTVDTIFTYQVKNKTFWGVPRMIKPDADNLLKSVWDDILATHFGIDDAAIFSGKFVKMYGEHDSIRFNIRPTNIQRYKSPKVDNKAKTVTPTVLERMKKRVERSDKNG